MTEKEKTNLHSKKNIRFSGIGLGEEKKYFIENLGMLLGAGINPESALQILASGTKSSRMRRTLEFLHGEIDNGSPLWLALERSGLLAKRYIILVKTGEQTGRIVENLNIIAAQVQKEHDLKSKIRSASLYPLFVLSLASVLGLGISWFILPRLAIVFSQLNVKLPLITKILIGIGNFLAHWGKIAIPAFLITLFFGVYIFFFFRKTRFIGQALLFHLPGASRLIKETELARFGYLMGTFLAAGISLTEALASLAETANFRRYKKLYDHLERSADEGLTFAQGFASWRKSQSLIPLPAQHLLMAAEQSGKLPETFLAIGERFEVKAEDTARNLTTMLEPILIIIIWLGVVFIALAVIMPIYTLISGLNK